MRLSKFYLVLLTISIGVFLYSCESVTNSVSQEDKMLTQDMTLDSSSKTKVDVCHFDAETDAYELINIANPAVNAHIEHGDALPGDPVPTMEGFVFDETCTPEPVEPDVVEISECFVDALNEFIRRTATQNVPELNFEEYTWEVYLDAPTIVYTIYTQDLGDELFLEIFLGEQCEVRLETNVTTSFIGRAIDSNTEENVHYLEYLLTLNKD